MGRLSLLVAAGLAAFSGAQSPLVTLTGGTNEGDIGGGIYFDLQIRATVTLHPAYLLRQPLQKRLAWRDFLAIKKALAG